MVSDTRHNHLGNSVGTRQTKGATNPIAAKLTYRGGRSLTVPSPTLPPPGSMLAGGPPLRATHSPVTT